MPGYQYINKYWQIQIYNFDKFSVYIEKYGEYCNYWLADLRLRLKAGLLAPAPTAGARVHHPPYVTEKNVFLSLVANRQMRLQI